MKAASETATAMIQGFVLGRQISSPEVPGGGGAHFLPTPSWIGPLFLRDRRVCPIAAVTTAAPITIKITSNVIVFLPSLLECVGRYFPSS
jgi:hypothetical protein